MKNTIKTTALTIALFAAATLAGFASDKETKKAVTFGTGIYKTIDGNINLLVDKNGQLTSTTILIRNQQNEVIYRETLSKSKVKFGRSLNISQLDPGSYQIEINSNRESQVQKFEVEQKTTSQVVLLNPGQ